mmetsp:Transcript_44116/g.111191  ORF Transcript_44116/g.111191 Transcript_44116/m.111191 type:complete len:281 (-) Transcript_44116:130-972(-)
MKAVFLALVIGLVALYANAAPDWNGSWSEESPGRLGGVLYTCIRGNRIHGVFSKAGWLSGNVVGVRATGNWYIAGDPFDDRDRMYGSFDISILDDNSGFRGEYFFGDREGRAHPWAESRLPAPFPACPDDTLCLTPNPSATVFGHWFGGAPATDLFLCHEFEIGKESSRVFGSFTNPDFAGSVEGFSPDDGVSFHGFYYTEDRAGGFWLRTISDSWIRGFRWPALPTRALHSEAKEQIFKLKTQKVSNFQCNSNEVFTPSSASTVSVGAVLVIAVLSLLF